jgi:hypothetical protein
MVSNAGDRLANSSPGSTQGFRRTHQLLDVLKRDINGARRNEDRAGMNGVEGL